ncbi:hypothetical protein C5S31_02665 [ANME-1 cluster archaeon GoMg2]|nr:hypothetical protein [ANME-1 cluster archaeon GoMg2]
MRILVVQDGYSVDKVVRIHGGGETSNYNTAAGVMT